MKNAFFATIAAVLAVCACQNPEDKKVAPETVDKIAVAPQSCTVKQEGGAARVIVSSSSDWTLRGKSDYSAWAVPSAAAGKDGDIVEFTVEPNTTGSQLVSEWVFTCGTATETYVLTSLAGEPVTLSLVSDAEVAVGYEAGRLTVVAASSAHYRNIKATIGEDAGEWLTYRANLEGEKEGEANIVFDYTALTSLDDRSAVITLSAEGAEQPVTVTLTQEAKHRLEAEKTAVVAKLDGETIAVPLIVNVAYKIEIAAAGQSWIRHTEFKDGKEYFAVSAYTEGSKRSADITFTQTDAAEGETPLTATVKITQQATLINWAAEMKGNRLFPKWEAGGPGSASNLTMEALIQMDNFTQDISTLMGIEGRFLLRFGDSAKKNELQVATLNGNYTVPFSFETAKWYHIACTYEIDSDYNATVKIYVNGELKGEKSAWQFNTWVGWPTYNYVYGIDFSPAWSYESDAKRCFWVGYSYDQNRSLDGRITEIRIWNKTLTAEEINAENHFYSVNPDAEGLFSYWKFTEGTGTSIADATGKGNALYGELNVAKQSSGDNVGTAGITFSEVSLPED